MVLLPGDKMYDLYYIDLTRCMLEKAIDDLRKAQEYAAKANHREIFNSIQEDIEILRDDMDLLTDDLRDTIVDEKE